MALTKQEGSRGSPVVDKWGRPAALENLYLGAHVFLLCCGPSIREIDQSLLDHRGVISFGINNISAVCRTNLWTFGDTPAKFHDAIWRDPGVLKFVPYPSKFSPKERNHIRSKTEQGDFVDSGLVARDFPSVFGVRRNDEFRVEQWLWEDTVNWGNSKKHKNGLPTVLNTMLQAMRLCYYLGFRTVYLLGADFQMTRERVYAFPQSKHEGGVRSNMGAYGALAWYFRQLKPWYDGAGFEVLNCNPKSELRVFDFIGFPEAVERAQMAAGFPRQIDTAGWYGGYGDDLEDEK